MDFTRAKDLVKENVKYIVIHHTASNATLEQIQQHALNIGWLGAGYNEFIDKKGKRTKVRGNKVGAHTLGHNEISYGIALQGNMENEESTKEQWEALITAVIEAKQKYKSAEIVGHRNLTATLCPGKNINIEKLIKDIEKTENIKKHWAEKHYNSLIAKGIVIHEKRYDDNLTRGEIFALLDRFEKYLRGD